MRELINNFLEKLMVEKNYSKNTIDSYLFHLDLFYEYLKNNNFSSYNELDYKDLRFYINFLYDTGYSNKSMCAHISTLRSFFKYLYDENKIENNYMSLISNPKLEKKLPKFLNYEDINKVLGAFATNNYIDIRNTLILEILYSTGIRVSELVNIKLRDIDFSSRNIKILGKGNKERIAYYGSVCEKLLNKYIDKAYKTLNKDNLDYLIISNTGKKINEREIRKIVDIAAQRAGLLIKISPHTLRHTFATHMLNSGADIRSVQELLGHENLSTTQVYTHVSNERLRSVYLNSHPRAKD